MNRISRQLSFLFSTKDTCLKNLHIEQKGRLVDFAGYYLPVYYSKGIIEEHLHCRKSASLFDVSHMGQVTIQGKDCLHLLQLATVGNTNRRSKLGMHECYLTMFLNEKAGIIDDAIATYLGPEEGVRIVVNGANKYGVMRHLGNVISHNKLSVNLKLHEQNGLIALQGPQSQAILQPFFPQIKLQDVPFMTQFKVNWQNSDYVVTRSGYTGEDGFQIGASDASIEKITRSILKNKDVELAGLGSRDSLRLEAGLCLHGHDISQIITPLEAGLMWTVFKRKPEDTRIKFIGEDCLKNAVDEVKNKKRKILKRAGFVVSDPGVIREHCKIFTANGSEIGKSTSGTHTPTLKKSVGMAYVNDQYAKEGTELFAEQRGKKLKIIISKMPFVPSSYYKSWGKQ